jgi:purine-binding chemotaxis protein CheW
MPETLDTTSNQYLTFKLDDDLYGLGIASVKEVLEYTQITKVPRTQEYMRGLINVRGNAVPVVDLKLKFGMDKTEQNLDTCIVIVEVDLEGEFTTIGTLVDGVEEVLEIDPGMIEPPPKLGTKINSRFMSGIGKLEDKFVIILNAERLFTAEELDVLFEVQESGDFIKEQTDNQ